MRKLLASAVFLMLFVTPTFAIPQRGGDDRHDDDEHHDHGRHLGWYKHHDEDRDEHRDWDDDHDREHPGRPYPHGRYVIVQHTIVLRSIDYGERRVILADRSTWVVASYDVDHCRDWRWGRDAVYVYNDDVHPGWYVLFNARLGRYVHVEYFGAP